MAERHDGPIPPGHGEPVAGTRDMADPVPVCPECGGMLVRMVEPTPAGRERDRGITGRRIFRCHVHGAVLPKWTHV